MKRVYLTQVFPWLLPLRRKQRLLFFYSKMKWDHNRYAEEQSANLLPYCIFETGCPMYNTSTGFDMVFQENKVFNLKLAAAKLNGLIIRPGETFSFWWSVRDADKETPYKEGLVERYGRLTTEQGGGLCMLSNLLFWMLLHTPMTITERHGHTKKDFPEPPSDAIKGVDATVSEGWLDLKLTNNTQFTYQIILQFDRERLYGMVFTDEKTDSFLEIRNGPENYLRKNGAIFEAVDILRLERNVVTGEVVQEEVVYKNRCEIGYQLPEDIVIQEEI